MTATVMWGANNIYSVRTADGIGYDHIRIKGKILGDTDQGEYNPLAPGDQVMLDVEDGTAQITSRLDRHNLVQRWNRKRRRQQAIAANVDRMFVVSSPTDPPYRAAFVDRVLVMAELEQIPAAIILNKVDRPIPPDVKHHLQLLIDAGYTVFHTIAVSHTITGGKPSTDIPALRELVSGSVNVLVGRSGVGKSSLINCLVPEADLVTGSISRKYNRGRHTTTLARQVTALDPAAGGAVFIDTPGVREFDLMGYDVTEIAAGFREFLPWLPTCRMPGCTHLHEPGCSVLEARSTGGVPEERYDSYARLAAHILEEQAR